MMVEEIVVKELIEECLERKREKAMEKGVRLCAAEEDRGAACRADRKLLRAALGNMVEAAIFYSRSGSVITVGCRSDDMREGIYVAGDNGCIPFDELRTMRDLFCRPTMPETRDVEELQMPMTCVSVVKDIADLHGGMVGVRSMEGDGLTLTLYLPRAQRGVA
ncbi:MAG: hypothetical protein HPY75_10250 [Actinobacteria bacterium]|nr:hypothetical protein [Actinomycetota bacterium]